MKIVTIVNREETVEILLDGEYLASANHDEDGWQGMHQLTRLATKLGRALGARVVDGDGNDVEQDPA